jgi:recombinational DNA repair protein RecT
VPADTDEDESDRPWKGVLTIAQLPGGGKPVWRYLTRKAVEARRDAGAAGKSGPWFQFEEAMVRKTGIRAIANDLPSSSIMSAASRALSEAQRADEKVNLWTVGQAQPQQVAADEPKQLEQAADAEAHVDEATGEVPATNPEPPRQQRAPRGRQQQAAPEPVTEEPPDPGPWTPPGPDGRP